MAETPKNRTLSHGTEKCPSHGSNPQCLQLLSFSLIIQLNHQIIDEHKNYTIMFHETQYGLISAKGKTVTE